MSERLDRIGTARRQHILYGDATGGGHLWPGLSGKSPFPREWSGDMVVQVILDIVDDPASTVTAGRGGRSRVTGSREGVTVRVIADSGGTINHHGLSRQTLNIAATFGEQRMSDESRDVAYYSRLQQSLWRLVNALGERLPVDDRRMIGELIDANECGLALETMCDALGENRLRIDDEMMGEVDRLASLMRLPKDLADRLRPLTVGS